MSSVLHGHTKYPCIRCLTLLEAFLTVHVGTERCYQYMERIYREAAHLWTKAEMIGVRSRNSIARDRRVAAEAAPWNVSLYKKRMCLDAPYIRIAKGMDDYDSFTVQFFHFFHLGISKRLRVYCGLPVM